MPPARRGCSRVSPPGRIFLGSALLDSRPVGINMGIVLGLVRHFAGDGNIIQVHDHALIFRTVEKNADAIDVETDRSQAIHDVILRHAPHVVRHQIELLSGVGHQVAFDQLPLAMCCFQHVAVQRRTAGYRRGRQENIGPDADRAFIFVGDIDIGGKFELAYRRNQDGNFIVEIVAVFKVTSTLNDCFPECARSVVKPRLCTVYLVPTAQGCCGTGFCVSKSECS